jgi:hypothetical protein
MPGTGLIIDFEGILAEANVSAKQRKLSDFQKAANQAVAREWEARYLPKHFEDYGARRYNLAQRALSTIKKKERMAKAGKVKHGGRRALIHGGVLANQMALSGILRVFPSRFTMRKPSHVPRRPRYSSIDLHAEVTKVIREEEVLLGKISKEVFLRELRAYKPRRRAAKRA